MKAIESRAVCPLHDRCDECGDPLGGLASVGHLNTDTGKQTLFHVMCAPPSLRKAYHEEPSNVR